MAKFGNAFMSLFLDKRARESLKAAKAAQPVAAQPAAQSTTQSATQSAAAAPGAAPQTPQTPPHPTQDEINARLEEAVEARARNAASPDRRALIDQARQIHADKSKLLDDLPEEQQRKLKAMALMALMKPPGGR